MKYKLPAFLKGNETPIEGEVAVRRYAQSHYPNDLFKSNCESVVVVGIDEVGRGPLAGPVVACAAVLKSPDIMPELNDSKKLTRAKREAMFEKVKEACFCYAIASASVEEIDKINILEADFLAMRRALQSLGMEGLNESEPEIAIEKKGEFPQNAKILVVVDGNLKIHGLSEDVQIPIIKGDGLIASISAASILAKVFRDRYMDNLAALYPGYDLENNAGYGTKKHLAAIKKQGYTPIHRKSFHPKSLL